MLCPQCKYQIETANPSQIVKHVVECTGWSIDETIRRLYNVSLLTTEEVELLKRHNTKYR